MGEAALTGSCPGNMPATHLPELHPHVLLLTSPKGVKHQQADSESLWLEGTLRMVTAFTACSRLQGPSTGRTLAEHLTIGLGPLKLQPSLLLVPSGVVYTECPPP